MMLARIYPTVPCEKYVVMWGNSAVTIEKVNGWYKVEDDFAKYISDFRVHESRHSALVFEVKSPGEAKAVEVEEKKVEDPKGTADKPRELAPRELPPSDLIVAKARTAARTGGRRGGKA